MLSYTNMQKLRLRHAMVTARGLCLAALNRGETARTGLTQGRPADCAGSDGLTLGPVGASPWCSGADSDSEPLAWLHMLLE
jgi:hypothetical protein